MFQMFNQIHAGSWVILTLLFIISYMFRVEITLLLQRFFYISIIGSGIIMLNMMDFPLKYTLKGPWHLFLL
ncbi:DUF1516 family protein [Bacillus cereus group sp. RP43]|uniref:DUF1516 family protein n=1 Tax=Bacillus cereus group sp. RP43 TaxID=3040260 RepID=UPI003398C27C